jgi:hypothetical protein
MSYSWHDDKDVEIEVEKDFQIDVELDYTLDVEVEKETDIEVYVDTDLELEGNYAEVNFDTQAYGDETFVQADIFVLTEDGKMSSASGTIISASDGGYW